MNHARAIALSLLFTAPLLAQTNWLAQGDQHYADRAQGANGAHADGAQVNAAIQSYQNELKEHPNNLEAHWKLLRAYRYLGAYVATTSEQKKQIYGNAKVAGEKAIALVNRILGDKAKGNEQQVAAAARAHPGIGEVFLWDAINWGEWALAYGKLAAARQGAADRIKRQATIALLIDPRMEMGSPGRVLGRLHDQTPRIPFITGWASSKEAVKFLSESLKIDPSNKITLNFLAEAMVSNDSSSKPQAIALLRQSIEQPMHPDFPVEDAAAVAESKALLKKFGA
jgi:hypothetical protein